MHIFTMFNGLIIFTCMALRVYAYTGLEELDGYNGCEVIDYMTGEDARLYNCSGIITLYQDYGGRYIDNDTYDYPLNALFNAEHMGFATFDTFPDTYDTTDLNLTKRRNVYVCGIQTAAGVCLNLITSFIEWASSHTAKAFKAMGTGCLLETQLVRHNGNGRIIRITAQNNRVSGADCDTSAQWKTISGAMEKWFDEHKHFCGTWCLDMTHSGDWVGYISLGVGESGINVADCKNVFTWGGECTQGGKNDYTGK